MWDGNVTHVASICSKFIPKYWNAESPPKSGLIHCMSGQNEVPIHPRDVVLFTGWLKTLTCWWHYMKTFWDISVRTNVVGPTGRPASLSLAPQAEWKWSISHRLNLIKHSARTRQGCSVSKHSRHAYKVVDFHLLELWLHQHTIIGGKGCSPAHTVWLTGDLWAVCCRNMTAPNASPSPHNPRHPTPEL